MGSLKCVALDFDGVLVDSTEVKRRAYVDIFDELGPEGGSLVARVLATAGERDRYAVLHGIVREARAAGHLSTAEPADAFVGRYAKKYNDICEEHAATCAEIHGASEVLARLAERYAVYVNSSTPDEPLRRLIRRRGWEAYFRGVHGSAGRKVENLTHVLRRECAAPEEAVFVGDAEVDRSAACAAGWHFVAIRNPYNDFREKPPRLCADLREAEAAILEL